MTNKKNENYVGNAAIFCRNAAIFSTALAISVLVVGAYATYDVVKNKDKRNLEKEIKMQNEARNYLNKYDINKNYVLDSTEFIKFYKEKK